MKPMGVRGQAGFYQIIALVIIVLAIVGIVIGLREVQRTQTLLSRAEVKNGASEDETVNLPEKEDGAVSEARSDLKLALYDIDNFTQLDGVIEIPYDSSLPVEELRRRLVRAVKVRVSGLDPRSLDGKKEGDSLPYRVLQCGADEFAPGTRKIAGTISFSGPCIRDSGVVMQGNNRDKGSKYPVAEVELALLDKHLESVRSNAGDARPSFAYLLVATDMDNNILGVGKITIEAVKRSL